MRCLIFYMEPEVAAAKAYAQRLRDEGYSANLRDGRAVVATEEVEVQWDRYLISSSCPERLSEIYRTAFTLWGEKARHKKIQTIELSRSDETIDPAGAEPPGPQPDAKIEINSGEPPRDTEQGADKSRLARVGADRNDGSAEPTKPPIPEVPPDYTSMPWFKLRSEVSKLTGVTPKSKNAALEALKMKGLI